MPVKQITDWTVFDDIQRATTTFIARLTRFRLISHPFENLHNPQAHEDSSQSPYPYPRESPWESPYRRLVRLKDDSHWHAVVRFVGE